MTLNPAWQFSGLPKSKTPHTEFTPGMLDGEVVLALHTQAGDDAALKVCVMFDKPLTDIPLIQRAALARAATGHWVSQRRRIADDFALLFGLESLTLPPIIAIAVGADSDNTKGSSLGYLSQLHGSP